MKNRKKSGVNLSNLYYMYGKHAVFAAINNNNRHIEKIYCLEKTFLEFKNKLNHFNIEVVSVDFINKKIGPDQPHQGILALVHSIFLNNINDLDFTETIDRVVILDQITDPQNIGAIIRSAVAFGITKLILPTDRAPEESAAIAKAASGCLELIQIAKVTNIKTAIAILFIFFVFIVHDCFLSIRLITNLIIKSFCIGLLSAINNAIAVNASGVGILGSNILFFCISNKNKKHPILLFPSVNG